MIQVTATEIKYWDIDDETLVVHTLKGSGSLYNDIENGLVSAFDGDDLVVKRAYSK